MSTDKNEYTGPCGTDAPFDYSSLALLSVELPDSLKNLRYSGRFIEELAEIDRLLDIGTHPDYDPLMRARLSLERHIALGLAADYGTSFDDMTARIREKHPSFTSADLLRIIDSGHADYIIGTDGIRFEDAAYSNICSCCADYLASVDDPSFTPEHHSSAEFVNIRREMIENGSATRHFIVKESIKPDSLHERPGELFRCWLPFPAITPEGEQSGIRLLGASHKAYITDSPIRTVYMEFKYHSGERAEITLEFSNTARYHDLSSRTPVEGYPAELREYTAELEPHILFTPYLKKLAAYLTEGAENPLERARRIYDYVTTHVRYSFMREYRLIDCIPMYAALNGRGDCGVQALLFITLCRLANVPAKWQSGNAIHENGAIGSHDWAMFYVEPFGWLYCDPSYGGGALENGDRDRWNWYFGNLDPYRYVCCTEFQRQLDPPKKYMRLDPYDNQSGEAEYENEPLGMYDADKEKSAECVK